LAANQHQAKENALEHRIFRLLGLASKRSVRFRVVLLEIDEGAEARVDDPPRPPGDYSKRQ
jgi:hypothetical protein